MDWPKVVAELKVAVMDGRPVRHQALVLLWAIGRARRGLPRTVHWSEARGELKSLLNKYGLSGSAATPEYPFVALASSPVWELSEEAPPAHGSAVLTWLNTHDPAGGLPLDVHEAVGTDIDERTAAVTALVDRFFPGEDVEKLLKAARVRSPLDFFGPVANVKSGRRFDSRVDAARAGVHREVQRGICGTKERGCESVAVVGGYEDDIDDGDVIIYTGEGGRDRGTGKQIEDQTLTTRNLSLVTSMMEHRPVRVLRGSTSDGYTYGGLFFVEDCWYAEGKSGYNIWQFKLIAIDSAKSTAPSVPLGNDAPGRRGSYAERVLRSALIAQWVKDVNDYTCQFCGQRYDTPRGPYAETAHVKPLGGMHAGPDVVENALCLCPTHHKLFDLGAFIITDDRIVVDVMKREPLGPLREVSAHRIDIQYAAYHRELRPLT